MGVLRGEVERAGDGRGIKRAAVDQRSTAACGSGQAVCLLVCVAEEHRQRVIIVVFECGGRDRTGSFMGYEDDIGRDLCRGKILLFAADMRHGELIALIARYLGEFFDGGFVALVRTVHEYSILLGSKVSRAANRIPEKA